MNTSPNTNPNNNTYWWGEFTLGHHLSHEWHIGPLTLLTRCVPGEWQLAYSRNSEIDEQESGWSINETDQLPESGDNFARFVFKETKGILTTTPLLADRAVIARPHKPFHLTAGEEATLYLSSPLWLQLAAGTAKKKLTEIAMQRPSDTWFGPSTLEGELAYASTTHCRLNLDELPRRTHRAITPLNIRNQADSTLLVERLNLPAPLLPLYASQDGSLWTPKITLTREKDGDMAALKVDNTAPSEAGNTTRVSEPRQKSSGRVLIRAFNAVFS